MPAPRTVPAAATAWCLAAAVLSAQDGSAVQPGAAVTPDAAVAQDPEFAALVAQVRAAHGGGREGSIDRFRAALRFKSVAKDQDSIEVDITATFLAPRYLRYRVEEPGKVLERGWDDRGAWARIGEAVESIAGREQEQERELVRQQVGLARQLLGFLDPAAVLEGLQRATVTDREELPVGRKETVTCDVVRGIAPQFPLFRVAEDGSPAEPRCGLKVYIDAETHLLRAVVATPLDAADRPAGPTEFVLLRDYTDRQQVAVPTRVLVYQGAPGVGAPTVSVVIRAIDVDPDGVTKETMRRPG